MKECAPVVVRYGVALVLLWFGYQQLQDPSFWIGFVPDFVAAQSPLPLERLVLLNGAIEILLGVLLALGVFVRIAAIITAIHIALIAYSLGNTGVAIRDWGLAFAALGVFLYGPDRFSLLQ